MKRHRFRTRFAPAALAVCLLLTALLAGCGAAAGPIELSGYIRPGYFGANGNGTAILDFDYAAFEQDVQKNLGDVDDATLRTLENAFTLVATPAEGLSNGDTVKITAEINEDALVPTGYELSCRETSALVQGLDATNYLDPFENIVVDFDGASPNVTMNIQVQSTEGVYGFLSYVPDCNTGLAIGDTVTVKVEYDPAAVGRMGVSLTADSMEYTVPEYLSSYPSDWSAFTDNMKSDMATDIKLQISSLKYRDDSVEIYSGGTGVASNLALDCSDYAYVQASFVSLKEGTRFDRETMDFCNALLVEYCFNAKSEGDEGEPTPVYGGFLIPDLAVGGLEFVQQSADFIFTTADLSESDWYAREAAPLTARYNVTPVQFEAAAVG